MSGTIFLLLALSPHFVVSYNVDTSQPVIYKDPESDGSNYFGYSVSLISGKNTASSSSLLVGAPQFSDGMGRVYRCTESPTRGQSTSSCQALEICNAKGPKPGWLGASTATGETSDSTVCAPRTIIPMKANSDSGVFLFNFFNLHGVCYRVMDTKGKCSLSLGYDPTTSGPKGLNGAYGFSVTYVGRNGSASDRGSHLIGLPVHDTVDIEPGGKTGPTSVPGPDRTNYGYSVSSGYFFQSRDLYYAVGAPSYMRKGMVDVFSLDKIGSRRTITINGTVIGEYFGASLATGDFDGDGRDDLAVGAPHWGEVDFGRVYIYHSENHEVFEQGQTLQGETRNGQFGYTLASADLDHDGCSDLIVSAPWEDSGAVYVYYGRRDFRDDNPTSQTIQRIVPSAFRHEDHIQRFGFSLSQPVDIDGNGYPDLAIGAYKSGHAIVLRSRPVVETKIEITSDPFMLQKSTEIFTVCVCVSYEGIGAPEFLDLSFDVRIDTKHNRIENGSSKEFEASFFRDNQTCVNTTMSLITSKDLRFLDPIEVELTHSIKKGAGRSEIDAVFNRRSLNRIQPLTIPFNTSCERGPVCNARLSINASFGGVGENNVWVVGSGDISLNIMVINEDEPAYQTQITVGITPGSRLRRTIEFCKMSTESFSLICDVGNPLVKGKPKSFTVELDMSDIDKVSAGPPMLMFSVTKSTRSIDRGAGRPTTILMLYTKHMAQVILTGATETRYIDYGRTMAKSKIPVRHAYQILKLGSSPITEAYLTIDVPTFMIGRNYSFLNINDTRLIDTSGKTIECSINDPPSKEDVPSRKPREIDETMFTQSDLPTRIENDSVDRTVYLNCSTEGISCKRLTCGFKVSKTHEDLENMVLDMIFNAEAFYSSEEDSLTIKFHTNSSVDIISPVISDSSGTRNWTASATTFVYNIAEAKKLDTWVIPASIFLGIILCFAVAIILFMIGFFNRSKKFEATNSKQPQSMNLQDKQNVGDNVETDPYG